MRKSITSTYRPLTRSVLSRPVPARAQRLATSAAPQTEPTMFSTPLRRFYFGTACATTAAWGALVFAYQWDEGGRRGDPTPTRLRNASTVLATKSLVVVGLGAVWPLAPFFLNACGQQLDMERRCREVKQRRIDEDRRLVAENKVREEARKHREKEEQQRREEQKRQEEKAREQERRKAAEQQATALGNVDILIAAGSAEATADRPLCRWCSRTH
nr:hypothetical protein [Pandoravirus massiliensis]